MAIIEYTAKIDPILNKHLEHGKKNQHYTSKTTQNDLIDIITHNLLSCEKIREALKKVQ